MKEKRLFGKILMVLTILFFYLPIIYMIVFSFNEGKSLTRFTGFSLRWYLHMLESNDMMEALYTTFGVAIFATAISTVVGTMAAIGISKSKKIVRDIMEQVNNLPMMNPEIVTAIGFMLLFITFKVEKGYLTMLLAHISFCIPYVMLSVMPKIKSLDPNLANAAMDLGATPWQALTKVIVPQIMPGIVSGALIAFTMSIDDFIISYFATGSGVKNISIMVYTMSKRINPSINAVSTLMIVIITIALLLVNIIPSIVAKSLTKPENRKRWAIGGSCFAVALVAFIIVASVDSSEKSKQYAGQTLHFYNVGEYIGEDVIAGFEEETGAKVVMETFDSNEAMYIKVANGETYDLIVPSDYMIQRLIEEDYLQKLDHSRLNCMDNLTDEVLNQSYDPGNEYSIPYFWGSVGIIYDKTKVDISDLEKDGFGIFLNEKYKGDIYVYDSERDSFMMALKDLGYSMNTENELELQKAYEWLVQCVETMEPEIVIDEVIDNMAQGRKALALVYSGDATYIMSENENMAFYLPESGTNIWCDAMVIPKNAKNPELAHEFINYVSSYDIAYENSSWVGYTSPNWEVMEVIVSEGGEFEGIDSYIPREAYEKDEVFAYHANTKKLISNLWSKVKIAASISN